MVWLDWSLPILTAVLVGVTIYYAIQNHVMAKQMSLQNKPLIKLTLDKNLDLAIKNIGSKPASHIISTFSLQYNNKNVFLGEFTIEDLVFDESEYISLQPKIFKVLEQDKLLFQQIISDEEFEECVGTARINFYTHPCVIHYIKEKRLHLELLVDLDFRALDGKKYQINKKYEVEIISYTPEPHEELEDKIKILIRSKNGKWTK